MLKIVSPTKEGESQSLISDKRKNCGSDVPLDELGREKKEKEEGENASKPEGARVALFHVKEEKNGSLPSWQ